MDATFWGANAGEWVQTIGGFLGALLAGGIAVWLFKKQSDQESKKEQIRDLENSIKTWYALEQALESIIQSADNLQVYREKVKAHANADNPADVQERSKDRKLLTSAAEVFKKIVDSSSRMIDGINDDYVPKSQYSSFLFIKGAVKSMVDHLEIALQLTPVVGEVVLGVWFDDNLEFINDEFPKLQTQRMRDEEQLTKLEK